MEYFFFVLSETAMRLKEFWKMAAFQRFHRFDDEDSALNDMFGIEFKSKLNRAKFMFDSTVCQSFLLTSLTLALALRLSRSLSLPLALSIPQFLEMAIRGHLFVLHFQMNSVRIRLIDTGEIIEHGQFNLQKLPHDIKSLPTAAFRCKINQVCMCYSVLKSRF